MEKDYRYFKENIDIAVDSLVTGKGPIRERVVSAVTKLSQYGGLKEEQIPTHMYARIAEIINTTSPGMSEDAAVDAARDLYEMCKDAAKLVK